MTGNTSYIKIKVAGNSMLPLLREGAVLETCLCAPEDIRAGDIAVIKTMDGNYLCHRVLKKSISKSGISLRTKGDARFRFDPPSGEGSFVGKVSSLNFGRQRIGIDNPSARVIGLLIGIVAPVFIRTFNRWAH